MHRNVNSVGGEQLRGYRQLAAAIAIMAIRDMERAEIDSLNYTTAFLFLTGGTLFSRAVLEDALGYDVAYMRRLAVALDGARRERGGKVVRLKSIVMKEMKENGKEGASCRTL